MRALVVFNDGQEGHPLGWLLKRGFRHCFVVLDSAGLWLKVDGERGVPTVSYVTTSDFDLAQFYRDHGSTVVETEQRQHPVVWPLVLRNCVGLVAAVLCLSRPVATPFGLYRHLSKG